MNGDKGFITFNVAKSSSTAKHLDVIGGFYLLYKESGVWKVKHHKEAKESAGKKFSSADFDSAFPKFKSGVSAFDGAPSLIVDGIKLNDICGANECQGNSTSTNSIVQNQKWSWT